MGAVTESGAWEDELPSARTPDSCQKKIRAAQGDGRSVTGECTHFSPMRFPSDDQV